MYSIHSFIQLLIWFYCLLPKRLIFFVFPKFKTELVRQKLKLALAAQFCVIPALHVNAVYTCKCRKITLLGTYTRLMECSFYYCMIVRNV